LPVDILSILTCQTVSIVWTKIKEALKPKPKAEKEREKKKRRMMDEAKSCKTNH